MVVICCYNSSVRVTARDTEPEIKESRGSGSTYGCYMCLIERQKEAVQENEREHRVRQSHAGLRLSLRDIHSVFVPNTTRTKSAVFN